jgi:hypothetical protein
MMTKNLKAVTRDLEGALFRQQLLLFGRLIISILRMGKQGLQREMDSFFRETENDCHAGPIIPIANFLRDS